MAWLCSRVTAIRAGEMLSSCAMRIAKAALFAMSTHFTGTWKRFWCDAARQCDAASRSAQWARPMVSTIRICISKCKNIAIGMSRDKFAQDFTNYYDPSEFIVSHRHLQSSGASYRVAMNTFTYDSRIQWDKLRNYSHAHTGGGSSEPAAAQQKARSAQTE